MSWDQPREFESGIDRGVFYPSIGAGEAWNGLVSVTELPIDSDEETQYIDGIKTHKRRRNGDFAGSIGAYNYPESFFSDVLTQQRASSFGMSYRTHTKNSYKIHLVYNILAAPSAYTYRRSDTDMHIWEFTTLPVPVLGSKRSAHVVIEASVAYPWTTAALEDVLYGTDTESPRLPLPDEVFDIFEANSILQIIDHGDGTWTAIGPDSAIIMVDPTTFEITWPSAVFIDAESYTISSL